MKRSFRKHYPDRVGQMLTDTLRHQALLLAGLIQREEIPDRVAWELVRILDASRCRARRRYEPPRSPRAWRRIHQRAHPAIGEFLHRLDDEEPDVLCGHPVCAK